MKRKYEKTYVHLFAQQQWHTEGETGNQEDCSPRACGGMEWQAQRRRRAEEGVTPPSAPIRGDLTLRTAVTPHILPK